MNEVTDSIAELLTKLANDLLPNQSRPKTVFGSWSADLWEALRAAGITEAPLPESAGGASMSYCALAPIVKLTGSLALPVPLAEHLVATSFLVRIGLPIYSSNILTLAPPTDNRKTLTNTRVGNSLYVSGRLCDVPWGNEVDFVVAALGPETVVLLPKGDVVRLTHNVAGEPRVDYEYTHTECVSYAEIAGIAQTLSTDGALMKALQLTGAMEKVLQLTLGYAETRTQFNRPLIRMQVIQQMVARLAGELAAANAATAVALESLGRQDTMFFVGTAKSRASEAAGLVAALAHQIHGAIGFTQEYELHLFSTRLWAWREEFGNERYWNAVLTSSVASDQPEQLWNRVTENDRYED